MFVQMYKLAPKCTQHNIVNSWPRGLNPTSIRIEGHTSTKDPGPFPKLAAESRYPLWRASWPDRMGGEKINKQINKSVDLHIQGVVHRILERTWCGVVRCDVVLGCHQWRMPKIRVLHLSSPMQPLMGGSPPAPPTATGLPISVDSWTAPASRNQKQERIQPGPMHDFIGRAVLGAVQGNFDLWCVCVCVCVCQDHVCLLLMSVDWVLGMTSSRGFSSYSEAMARSSPLLLDSAVEGML
ncbi:hypothetical protein LY76DRAFT_135984 [Colletotrichum caudatum]|nr:hypothetical protein LY76DRAFT_135984 [Colletotrichum caudatum]